MPFEQLLSAELDRAYAMALRLTRNAADAEDLVQDAALLAHRGFASFEPGSNFRAWFLRILMNAFLSSKRRHRPEDKAESIDEVPNAYIQRSAIREIQSPARDVALAVVGGLEAAEVQRAVDELPEDYRTVCALYFLEDLSYQDIADMLRIPIGTVRSRLHRGRALLQKKLWRLAQDNGLVTK